jgi:iron complex outermembrane recepter protein
MKIIKMKTITFKLLYTSILMLCFTPFIFSQTINKNSISGTVLSNKEAVENAVVLLLKATDSSIVKTTTTTKEGLFVLNNFANGVYLVSIQNLGHQKYFSGKINILDALVSLPTITIIPIKKEATNVTVTAKKPLIEVRPDKVVVNVEANTTNVGANALEVLQKSPGVTVDKDGKISLKGNSSVVVYIDGRPSYLSGADLSNMLSSMQSSQLDVIEIMTNPPAKYDAAGNGGVIHIKTKKTKTFGFSGSVTLNAGIGMSYPRFGETVNLSYRKNKFTVFGNFNHSYREKYQILTINRSFIDATTNQVTSLFTQTNKLQRINRDYSSKIGLDYNINKKTTVGMVLKNSYSPANSDNDGNILLKKPSGVLESTTLSQSPSKSAWTNFSTNLNLRHVFDSTGKELNMNADYISYNATNNLSLINAYYKSGLPNEPGDTLLGNLPQKIKIYGANIDYSMPIHKTLNFEAGIKTSFVETNADAKYDSLLNGIVMNAVSRTNFFNYKENITAAYINFDKKFNEKFSLQTGLRFENTLMNGLELTTNKSFRRNYAQLFPTAYFQYSPSKKHSYVLNYGRRIKRPDYENLNPFVEYLDKYTFEEGNPFLQPQFSHSIELTHTYKGFLSTTLNYTTTNNIIQQVFITNANKTETAVKLENIASSRSLGLSSNASIPVTKWFSANVFMTGNYNEFKGIINNSPVKQNLARFAIQLENQFQFKKGWNANISAFYLSGEMEGVMIIKPLYNIDLGVGKTILKKKGSIRFSFKDIFWTQAPRGFAKYNNVDVTFKQYSNSQAFNLSFTYRFKKGTLKAANQRKVGGAEDEQNRVSGK